MPHGSVAVVFVALALLGCQRGRSAGASDGAPALAPEEISPPGVPAPPPPPPEPAGPPPPVVFAAGLIGARAPHDAADEIVPLRLEAGRVEVAPAIAAQHVAVDGDAFCVASGAQVSLLRPFSKGQDARRATVSCQARSLHLHGDRCFVGCSLRVDAVDFGPAVPLARTLHDDTHPEALAFKAEGRKRPVDFFLRTPARLWAVDDEERPKWVYLFDLREEAKFLARVSLPQRTSRPVTGGATHGERIYLLEAFEHQAGSENRITRLAFRDGRPTLARVAAEAQLRQRVPSSRNQRIIGDTFTAIAAMTRVGDRLVLAARERGIILLGLDGASPRLVATGGSCDHVVGVPGGVLALVDEKTLVELRWDAAAQTLAQVARHPLPRPFGRLAR